MSLANDVISGNRLALARLLTQIENGTAIGREALSEIFKYSGQAHLIGITGSPGTGKSTLVNGLTKYFRNPPEGEKKKKVAIVAVDPSSPFTGGAILGDRVRMRELTGDPGVFIRSMATRGSLGGLAISTSGIVQALDAAGFDIVIIETVGAGQAEVDIARLAHTTLVIEAPGLGDDIQAIKAGILEIADVIVINKADRPGFELTERALRGMLLLAHPTPHIFSHFHSIEPIVPLEDSSRIDNTWIPPIHKTIATEEKGVQELAEIILRHRNHLLSTGEWKSREKERLQSDLLLLIQNELIKTWQSNLPMNIYDSILPQIYERKISPWQAVQILLNVSK